ncbi:MAG: hypothetical protein HY394_00575 [Candidatus Diapherotrites archaeon]|nr:hypothetical protein [Candidatus Diapherotrites archaeon]
MHPSDAIKGTASKRFFMPHLKPVVVCAFVLLVLLSGCTATKSKGVEKPVDSDKNFLDSNQAKSAPETGGPRQPPTTELVAEQPDANVPDANAGAPDVNAAAAVVFCNRNGACDTNESAVSCPADCAILSGGGGGGNSPQPPSGNDSGSCNSDGACNGNEDTASCPADCSVRQFRHYLRFYALDYYNRFSTKPPAPEGLVEFTITQGTPFGNLQDYTHFNVTDSGHVVLTTSTAPKTLVALSQSELDGLFAQYGFGGDKNNIYSGVIARAEVGKIHEELVERHPELFPNGTELFVGAVIGPDGLPELVDNFPVRERSDIADYQLGKTMVYPLPYSPVGYGRYRTLWNHGSWAVRVYLARRANKLVNGVPGVENIFLDNVQLPAYIKYLGSRVGSVPVPNYVSPGSRDEQFAVYANNFVSVLTAVRVKTGAKMLLNGLYEVKANQSIFFQKLIASGQFDGLMTENGFFADGVENNLGGSAASVQWYWDQVQWLKQNGKNAVFLAGGKDASKASKAWLWVHLVADTNVFFSTNPNEHFDVYDSPLGYPLDQAPVKNGSVWSRRYERGTIVFDVSGGRLDDIKFVEGPA